MHKDLHSLFSEMEKDIQKKYSPQLNVNDSGLSKVSDLAEQIQNKKADISAAEAALKEQKEELRNLEEHELPNLMAEIGVASFTLSDGSQVDIKPIYAAHISKEKQEAAWKWLRDNGHGDIIKNTISLSFKKGEDAEAAKFMEEAKKAGIEPEQKTGVHHQTLKGWVTDMVTEGHEFPMELFGAYVSQKAIIKKGK